MEAVNPKQQVTLNTATVKVSSMTKASKQNTLEIDPRYSEILERQATETAIMRAQLALPPLTANQSERLQNSLPINGFRLAQFLFDDHQGARTDAIRTACSIGNISDCVIATRDRFKSLGLEIACKEIRSINKYGDKRSIGLWWLNIIDPDLWGSAHLNEAANDPVF